MTKNLLLKLLTAWIWAAAAWLALATDGSEEIFDGLDPGIQAEASGFKAERAAMIAMKECEEDAANLITANTELSR